MEIRTREGRFESRSANPMQPWGSTAPPPPGMGSIAAGVSIDEKTALQLAAVWGSVSLISDSLATLPIQQYKLSPTGEPTKMASATVIERPWEELDQADFITQGSVSMLLRGNLWGRRIGVDERGCPSQIQLVHPDHARIRRAPDGPKKGQLEVRYWNQPVPWDQVTRKMALSGPEDIQGYNPIEYLRNMLGLARAQDLFSGAFFSNSARPDGVIEFPEDVDDDEVDAALDGWLAKHQGYNRAFLPAILTGGATWKPISMSLADVQFLQQMQFSESVISGRIYRVPPHMLGMVDKDTSWGSGIEQQELGFVRNTLGIWLRRWEDLFTSWLPSGQFAIFDLSQRLRGDTLQRFQAYQIARICGFMNNLDVMHAEGMPTPTDPDLVAQLSDYAAPLNSSPLKVGGPQGPGGDKAN